MIDISKFVTVDENGKAVIDTDAYKSAYDSEMRKSLDTNSENTRKKLEAEIRKSLAEEAKLSAEEKLKKEREDFEASMAQRLRDFAQYQAKSKMKSAGLDEEEIATYLELVTDEESIAKIDKLLDLRNKRAETLKKEWEQSVLTSQKTPETSNSGEENASYGATMAREYQSKAQTGPKVSAWGQ